jgi:hypothetical protein
MVVSLRKPVSRERVLKPEPWSKQKQEELLLKGWEWDLSELRPAWAERQVLGGRSASEVLAFLV